MENAPRDIHRNSALKLYQMKMIILSINDGKLLKENGANSNPKVYGSTIDGLFHTAHIFPNVTKPTSMSKYAQASVPSNTFSNTFTRVVIVPLQCCKVRSM